MGYLFGLVLVVVIVYALARMGSGSRASTPTPRQQGDTITLDISIGNGFKQGSSSLNWVGPEENLQVGRITIPKAMTYTSKGAPKIEEASCIDTKLKVGVPVAEPKGALGYWPKYAEISPDQRANYLSWLTTGRRGDLHDIGYAFIFFYGLERRTLVDGSDMEPAIDEVIELLRTYPESRSFRGYLSSFLAYVAVISGLQKFSDSGFNKIFNSDLPLHGEDALAVALAWLQIHQRPLPATIAYEVARIDSRSPRSVVLKRMPEEHQILFTQKYEENYGDGLTLRSSKRDTSISYHPASPTMFSYRSASVMPTLRIPHVLGISSQFKGLVGIWAECIAELKKASTQIGKGLDVSSREVYENLPNNLRANYDHPDKPRWDELVAANVGTRGYAKLQISSLAELRDISFRPKLTKTQSIDIARVAQQMDYALIPDPWTLQRPYTWEEKVAIITSDGKIDEESNSLYHAAALMLELGMGIAAADGKIDREEVVQISHAMRDQFRLQPEFARRLEVYRSLLIHNPPSLSGLAKRINELFDTDGREALARYMVGIAAADGFIHREERKALKKLYQGIGISIEKMEEFLSAIETPAAEPVVVKQRKPGRKGEVIPEAPTVTLNTALVQKIIQDTAEVATMIGKAMGEFDQGVEESNAESAINKAPETATINTSSDTPESNTSSKTNEGNETFVGLESRYGLALEELVAKNEWERQDLEDLARRHALMPNGLIDEINAWADECLGDYLIEGEGPYTIRGELLGDIV